MKKKENKDKNKKRSEGDLENTSDASKHQPLPGDYPANEDIMNRKNDVERVGIDPDNLSRTPGKYNNPREDRNNPEELTAFPPAVNSKGKKTTKSDLTKEDYEALGPRDLSMDGGDDEQLKHRVWPVDFAARDLDVPTGDDDRLDATGQGDEENDHYSLGGDDKENLEEDPTRTFG